MPTVTQMTTVLGVYLYLGGVLIQCYASYGFYTCIVAFTCTAVALSVIMIIWLYIVLRLQADGGLWETFAVVGRKDESDGATFNESGYGKHAVA
jgi:hypothetical protein